MLTSMRCLAKADELDAYLLGCTSESQRKACIDVATGWRWVATLAAAQEAVAAKLAAAAAKVGDR